MVQQRGHLQLTFVAIPGVVVRHGRGFALVKIVQSQPAKQLRCLLAAFQPGIRPHAVRRRTWFALFDGLYFLLLQKHTADIFQFKVEIVSTHGQNHG